jgi:hypothetical protein
LYLHVLLERSDLLGDFEVNSLACACCGEPLSEGNIGGVFFEESSHNGLAACHRVDCIDKVRKLVLGVPKLYAC